MSWNSVPSKASLKLTPFEAHVPEDELSDFKQLLKLSKIGPATYENQREDRYFGISRAWLQKAKQHWETQYDW
jgi:microsomal epoxide hydrolase